MPLSLLPEHAGVLRVSLHHQDALTAVNIPIPNAIREQCSRTVDREVHSPAAGDSSSRVWDVDHRDTMSLVTTLALQYSTLPQDATVAYTDADTHALNRLRVRVHALVCNSHTGLHTDSLLLTEASLSLTDLIQPGTGAGAEPGTDPGLGAAVGVEDPESREPAQPAAAAVTMPLRTSRAPSSTLVRIQLLPTAHIRPTPVHSTAIPDTPSPSQSPGVGAEAPQLYLDGSVLFYSLDGIKYTPSQKRSHNPSGALHTLHTFPGRTRGGTVHAQQVTTPRLGDNCISVLCCIMLYSALHTVM